MKITHLFVALALFNISAAEAKSFKTYGYRGRAAGFTHQGQYGQAAAIGGQMYGGGAAGAAGFRGYGPNGGVYKGGRAGMAIPGVGAVGGRAVSGTSASGNHYAGYGGGAYNAQSGQGLYNGGKSYTHAQTGQQYGYDQSTQFVKGQGGQTTIQTENKGDYTVDWQKGQKPSVTQTVYPAAN
ncbi:MAG: hypothetical protein K2W82_06030 [Candidatus Obscuribacterales bacterium]|nr:hypothetical protein [Candidatus Obscuribacterales bacterium]